MKRLILICIAIPCLITTVAFGADRQVTVTRVEQEVQPPALAPQGAAGVCVMGNTNAAAYAITDWVWGAESYKYMLEIAGNKANSRAGVHRCTILVSYIWLGRGVGRR